MKKFALGILSVFMILGGVLLSGCDKKVSLSVSDKEIVLFTNDENAENNKSKEIEVDIENSKFGVNVEVRYGQDCINIERTHTTSKKANGKYAFKVLTKEDKNSGVAQIKVSSIEDSSKYEYINITVNTIVESMEVAEENSEEGKSNLFAVKGVDKELVTTEYFDLLPIHANIVDIDWTFENGEKELFVDDKLYASLDGATLKVSEDCSLRRLDVVASYVRNKNISRKLPLEVLDNSTVKNYSVEDNVFYRNGVIQTTEATVVLKRNNSHLSSAEGTLVLDVSPNNELRLSPIVYKKENGKSVLMSSEQYEKYFTFDYSERDNIIEGTKTYNIYIDAIDNSAKNIFGQFEIYLNVDYAGYNYSVSTLETKLVLDIAYSATIIELSDENGYSINNTFQDVFSSYETSFGYQVNTIVGPTDVAIDDRYFRITLDTRQSAISNLSLNQTNPVGDIAEFFLQDGTPLQFTQSAPGSSIFASGAIETGSKVFVKGCDIYDELEGVEFKFESRSNASVNTSLYITFFKIAEDKNMTVESAGEEALEEITYLSSSVYSDRRLDFTVKVSGVATESGLSLCNDGMSGFEYSNMTLLSKSDEADEESFVVVTFSVSLNNYNFADVSTFWFEHITGKKSAEFKIETFVPIESLTIQNSDKSSANVYADISEAQAYVVENGMIEVDASKQSFSLSKLMLEAGTSLPIYTAFQNATLAEGGISYRYMSYESLRMYLRILYGIEDGAELDRLANEAITNGDLSVVANTGAFMHFDEIDTGYFSISSDLLTVSNRPFKGFVAVLVEGYNENHETITLARFFALESFYSVRFLSSNVKTTLLYTADTLSLSDMSRSIVDVTISMRQDDNIPTYSGSLDYFNFTSALQDFVDVSGNKTMLKNDFYTISNVSFANNGKDLTFRITARSTNLQTSVKDILKIVYIDSNGFEKISEIQIEIRNVKRLESVQWVNRTADNEIYLNLTSTNASEKNFTISTSVEPSDANDIGLTSVYVASSGSSSDIKISTSSIGQIFNVNINTTKGGKGSLYLLPNDMIKNVDGFNHVLVYKYVENEDGSITEIPVNIPLSSLGSKYEEILAGSDEISNYFYNNEGEKIYYRNLILKIDITIADGNSEGTAIRVYNQGDLEEIDYAKYYRVMNDITLSGWKAYGQFSGMIYGNDENVTLKFTNGSENFVNTLNGTLKDLTFVGDVKVGSSDSPVANAGFVANSVGTEGRIENCAIDVYYSNVDNNYFGSVLTAYTISNAGMIAGLNDGTISNVHVYGGSINAPLSTYVGGLVGENNGEISGSGFEFYRFENSAGACNTITTGGSVGGLVGLSGGSSVVETSYVYAYALPQVKTTSEGSALDYSVENIIDAQGVVGVLAGGSLNGARFSEVFGFLGDVSDALVTSGSDQYVTIENSYITYYADEKVCSNIYKLVTYSYANGDQDFVNGTETNWTTLTDKDSEAENANLALLNLDENVWNLEKTDSEINFGYIYLRNVAQSTAVDLENVHVEDSQGEYDERLRVLNSGNKTVGGKEYETGILFMFNPINSVVDVQEKAMLDRLNTISVSTLFGISAEQARGLLLTSESRNISLSANSIKILNTSISNTSISEFEITVHSKMDFTQVKTFKFVILNVLPSLSTTIDGVILKDNQMILLQTGSSRTLVYDMLSSLYLNGTTPYALNKDNFTINFSYLDGDDASSFVGIKRSSNSLILSGLTKHESDDRTTIYTSLSHNTLSADANYSNYADAVGDKISRTFDARVYNGAKRLEVTNANNMIVRPSEYATFDVVLETDEESDGLVFSLKYDQIEVTAQVSENFTRFDVDSNLSLEVSSAIVSSKTTAGVLQNRYNVYVRVSDDTKHLVAEDYSDLTLSVNAASQSTNTTYVRNISMKVETQGIEDFSISTYAIERRQIRNSILYLSPSSQIVSALSPASDAIVSVSITPEYAKVTHFTLTYEVDGSSVGTVGLSKLAYNSLYGYYANSSSSAVITNGIRVTLTDEDKTGNGLFYFRLYISSSFASTSGLRLVTTFYDGDKVLMSGSQMLTVDYMQDAVVRVNDATTYLLAKGESATVTVRVGLDQDLADLYLQNNESKITLSEPTVQVSGNYKIYTAEISAGVDARLVGGKDSGIFYVCATVRRTLNNIQEEKVSRATLCLVDFSVDTNGISVVGSGNKRTYNGKQYDVFNAYLNDSSELHFDYPLLPEEYNYDKNDSEAVRAVAKLTERRNQFLNNNYYRDAEVDYSINCVRNAETGLYDAISLKQQLWTVDSQMRATAIYNANTGRITQNERFYINEETLLDGSTRIMISGRSAGTQLMMLRTIISYQGIELVADYYFLIVVEVWTDEESPTQITSGEQFVKFATESEEPADYILMNDIVLSDYSPIPDTTLLNSLDGNGFTIHLNSFKPGTENSLRLALFDTVSANTTLKNVRVNIYNGGQIFVNIKQYNTVEIAGFALKNEGVIYNCEVISYFDEEYQVSKNTGNSGLVVKYTNGANTTPIPLTVSMNIESRISGFVLENEASIINSRVGGESFKHVVVIGETSYLKSQALDVFYLEGQVEVSGFVNTNSGYVSASFVKNVQIDNIMEYDASITAGFVIKNSLSVQNSYVEGLGGAKEQVGENQEEKEIVYNNLTNISSLGVIAGFVYENDSLVKNSYSNIAIENSKTKGAMVAGFVYKNNAGAEVALCYSACEIAKKDITQMQFSGVDDFTNSLNFGTISLSYFFNDSRTDDTIQSKITTSAIAVFDVSQKNSFYGFSFNSEEGAYNGIWEMRENGKITLVSANQIAISNRYAATNGRITSVFYSRSIRDIDTLNNVDLSYGSAANPIILRNAADFAKATGKATEKEISSYKEYYTDTEVTGRYRIVNNIVMTDIAQDAEDEGSVKLTTTQKVFRGLLDGNGFTISKISLGSSESYENFGLFARLSGAVIMNLDLTVESVHDTLANNVGVLAGTAVDSRILAITLSPSDSASEGASTAVQGRNVVGGVVGMLFGESFLSDINVSNVDVASEWNSTEEWEIKGIGDNKVYIEGDGDYIKSLRELAEDLDNGISLTNNVVHLSYAGAIAGYIDSYSSRDEGYVTYSTSREVSDYDVVTVHVSDSINIYAEVAGGLFGYVGKSTLIYDATLTINQNQTLTTTGVSPSYIISKNLFAGGLVGENYGALFAVSAVYEENLQSTIETNENSYYKQSTGSERGQMSIFSLTPNDEGYSTRRNKPRFIGGLVGYMGGGYIYVGQSKLNVISHTGAVVGGVVGLSGVSSSRYNLNFTTERKSINTLYYEVYASGDVYSEGGVAAGIIGALEADDTSTGIVAMKNVMAMNYYSYTGFSLTGDVAAPDGTSASYVSDNHYMLVGGIYQHDALQPKDTRLFSDFYLINSINDIVLNLKDGAAPNTPMGSYTIGGYKEIAIGSVVAKLNEFGFYTPASTAKKPAGPGEDEKDMPTILEESILKAQHISSDDLSTPASAYARMKNYFTSNGWDEKYWTHKQNCLFPDIILLPKVSIKFWDVDNTAEILQEMEGSSSTIVVRGRVKHDDENCYDFQDIDLTGPIANATSDLQLTIENFSGRLVSYASYMNSQEGGKVTSGSDFGGAVGERVGIILKQSLFEKISGNASIEGLTFYMKPTAGKGFSLISNEADTALLRNINIVVNGSMTITADANSLHTDAGNYKTVGLIAGLATSTSFFNIEISLRGDGLANGNDNVSSLTFSDSVAGSGSEIYMGLLAGRIRQTSSHSQMSISGVSIGRANYSNAGAGATVGSAPIDINFRSSGSTTKQGSLYAGIYAGDISKASSGAAISVGVRQINNVNLNIESSNQNELNKVYIGGYAGSLTSADKVELVEGDSDDRNGTGISIYQNFSVNQLYAGLAFGQTRSSIQFSFERVPSAWLIGRVIQGKGVSTRYANIGSITGNSSSMIDLTGLRVKFDVANASMFEVEPNEKDSDGNKMTAQKKFAENVASIKNNQYSYEKLKPFVVSESSDNIDNSFGGIIGYSTGSLKMAGASSLTGNIVAKAQTGSIYVGGAIGRFSGANSISIGGIVSNEINMYADADDIAGSAYVGGFVGAYKNSNKTQDTGTSNNVEVKIGTDENTIGNLKYTGIVVASQMQNLYFGGAVGQILTTTGQNEVVINGFVFGGALKILVKADEKVAVGGVVGAYDQTKESTRIDSSIQKSVAYGDVFVIYSEYKDGQYQKDELLSAYAFGGIVGSAQKGVKIKECVSLLTNFNRGELKLNAATTVGAIVGENADAASSTFESGLVYYEGNRYSSVVTMTIQEQDGNLDCGYGAPVEGYTTRTGAESTSAASPVDLLTSEIRNLASDAADGHKLNPHQIKSFDGRQLDSDGLISGNFNNIKWVSITQHLQGVDALETSLASNLTNMVIVGNGRNIEVELSGDLSTNGDQTKGIYAGGIADNMGVAFDKDSTTNILNFNMISGMILDLNIVKNIVNSGQSAFGGVAGNVDGNSFIYGVGVKGELSVGGDTNIQLGGIVGRLRQGRIDQCYVDADIAYRGNQDGRVAGAANMVNLSSTIKATYTSGKIIAYVDAPIYTFASAEGKTGVMMISDCYSIAQVERNDIFASTTSTATDNKIFFAGDSENSDETSITVGRGQVVNGTAEVVKNKVGNKTQSPTTKTYVPSSNLALSYNNETMFSGKNLQVSNYTDGTLTDANKISENTWYFSRYTNYGYASHGFGYLKNSTTYTRDKIKDSTGKVTGYEYTPVPYSEIIIEEKRSALSSKDEDKYDEDGAWYFGIPSVGKFEQMLETVTNNTSGKKYKFIMRYGFALLKMQKNTTTGLDTSNHYTRNAMGYEGFVLDGNGNTIDLSGVTMYTGLFGILTGSVRDIRLINGKMTPTTLNAGLLASSVIGSIADITVVGDIATNSSNNVSVIGGVVGTLNGDATRVESLVNITNKQKNAIIGGVVGVLGTTAESGGDASSVEYASNAGILINSPGKDSPTPGVGPTVKTIKLSNSKVIEGSNNSVHAITGGIVGRLNRGTVSHSYNANSVLSNFDGSLSKNVVSGGIVGYAYGLDNNTTKIQNCYNVALVGSGNYSSGVISSTSVIGISYAGGIVGYALKLTMTGSINDGPVQALGKEEGKYAIEVAKDSGTETTSSAETEPEDLCYKITMKYNPNNFRMVNAYGLGYAESGSIGKTNSTTTNNVKNDGNIGEFVTTSYLTFKRQLMLDGDGKNYAGKFTSRVKTGSSSNGTSSVGLNISGLDSYGFPARVYGVDKIERTITSSHPYYSAIVNNINADNVNSSYKGVGGSAERGAGYYGGVVTISENNGSSSSPNETERHVNSAAIWTVGIKSASYSDLYKNADGKDTSYDQSLTASTEYYSSSVLSGYWGDTWMNFDGYDAILQHVNKYSHFVGTGASDNLLVTSVSGVNEKIREIDTKIEKDDVDSNVDFINVNGTNVGVAKTANHVTAILTPFSAELTNPIEFNLSGCDAVNDSLITKNSIEFICGTQPSYSEYDIEKVYTGTGDDRKLSSVKVTGLNGNAHPVLYFAKAISQNIAVRLNVRGDLKFKLKENNSYMQGNTLIIPISGLDESLQDEINLMSGKTSDEPGVTYEIGKATVDTLSNLTVTVVNDQIRVTGSGINSNTQKSVLDGNELKINYIKKFMVTQIYDVKFDITSNVMTADNLENKSEANFKYTFENFDTVSKTAFPALSSFSESAGVYTISENNFISSIGMSKSNVFAYNISDGTSGVAVYWNGSAFTFNGTNVTITSDGTNISVSGADAQNFINWASGQTASMYVGISDKSGYRNTPDEKNPANISTISDTIFGGVISLEGDTERKKFSGEKQIFHLTQTFTSFVAEYTGTSAEFENLSTVDDDWKVTPINVGGIEATKLRSVEVSFNYHFTAELTSAAANKSFQLEMVRDGQVAEIKYFSKYFDNTTSGPIGDIKLGDRLVYKTANVEFEREIKNFGEYSENGDGGVSTIKFTDTRNDADETTTYTLEKGSDNLFGFGKLKYVSTKKRYEKIGKLSSTIYTYEYKIWENGIIELEYSDGDMEYINYIYTPIEIVAGSMTYTEVDDSGNSETITQSWDGCTAGFHSVDKNYVFGTGDDKGLIIGAGKYAIGAEVSSDVFYSQKVDKADVVIDTIVVDYDSKNIIAVRGTSETLQINAKCDVPMQDDLLAKVQLSYGHSQTITISGATTQEIKYTKDGEPGSTTNDSITFSSGGTYEVEWNARFESGNRLYTTGSTSVDGEADYVLLAGDINMGASKDKLQKSIIGANYIVRFASDGNSLFGAIVPEDSGNLVIRDVVFAGGVTGVSETRSLFAKGINQNVTISNTTLYGSIRNLPYNTTTVGYADSKVYTDYYKTEDDSKIDIKNHVSITGLNAPQGYSVQTTLSTHDGFDTNGTAVLVAGDAVKSSNATESYNVLKDDSQTDWKTRSSGNRDGGAGSDGKDGGKIVATAVGANGLRLVGRSSIGGYGGDGSHGWFDGKAYGGGKAGAAGSNGDSKTLHISTLTQYRGNSGIGGFGRIVKVGDGSSVNSGFKLYTSGNGGTESDQGANGSDGSASYTSTFSRTDGRFICLFGAKGNTFCNSTSYGYVEHSGYGNSWNWDSSWLNNINGEFAKFNSSNFTSSGGVSSTGKGNSVYVKKIYVYEHIFAHKYWNWKNHTYKVQGGDRHAKISWTSGETVNSAGAFTHC